MTADTTLMMVTYNRLELTRETLEGLWSMDPIKNPGRPYNLVIVDNGSTDGTIDYLRSLGEQDYLEGVNLEITYLPENKGIAIGRNDEKKQQGE